MKKIFAILLSLALMLSLAVPAMADSTDPAITVPSNGHTYEVYQIFKGDLADGVLSNIVWGKNGTGKEDETVSKDVLDALAAVNGEDKTNTEKLAVIKTYVNLSSTPIATLGKDNALSATVKAGYYLIKDKDNTAPNNEAYTTYIVEVVDSLTINPKADVPEFEKKVKDINDSTDAEMSDWQDSADHDKGDDVPFQLKATLADNVADYPCYKVVFHDKLSDGLDFNANSVKVYIDGEEIQTGFSVETSDLEDDCTFEVIINDAKAVGAGNKSKITVEYTATLNENAVMGSVGNPNVAELEYSNNPNWTPEYDENGKPENPGESPTGETPEDKVIVFTYKVVVNKVTENPKYDADSDKNNTGVDAAGNKQYEPLAGAGFTLYKWDVVTEATETTAAVYNWVDIGGELTGTQMTQFVWERLDDGNYKLVETTTPAGYNTIAPIEFTISAKHDLDSDNPQLTELTGGNMFTGEVSTGELTGRVINNAGTVLPETGGMGTTIFYAVGGVMVAAAAILLITKKRMSAEG